LEFFWNRKKKFSGKLPPRRKSKPVVRSTLAAMRAGKTLRQPAPVRMVHGKTDWTFALVVVLLSVFGAIMIYSGSAIVAVRQGNSPYFYFLRQLFFIFLGLIAAYFMYRIDYHIIAKFALPAVVVSIILLLVVLLVDRDQAIKRWINIGPFDLQPSELVKLSLLVYLSSWLSKQRDKRELTKAAFWHHVKYELMPFILLLAFVCGLILIEPDMDTTIMLGATAFIVYFLSGNDVIHLIGSFATGLVSGIIVFFTMFAAKYRLARLDIFFEFWRTNKIPDPYNTGYQFQQILVAVASGGFFGLGFGQSRQKYHYLGDTAFSDTIFAIFAEEFGLFGCIILISVFLYIFFKGYKFAVNAQDKLGFLLAVSITTWIFLQAALHIGANVALIPINGNTLPFLSYGGSSTVVNLAAMGLLLNVGRSSAVAKSELKPAELMKFKSRR